MAWEWSIQTLQLTHQQKPISLYLEGEQVGVHWHHIWAGSYKLRKRESIYHTKRQLDSTFSGIWNDSWHSDIIGDVKSQRKSKQNDVMLELSTTNQRSTVTIRFFAYQRYYMYMIGGQLHMNIGSLQILISARPNRYNHHHAIAIIVCTMIISANPICYAYPVACDKIRNRKSTSTFLS